MKMPLHLNCCDSCDLPKLFNPEPTLTDRKILARYGMGVETLEHLIIDLRELRQATAEPDSVLRETTEQIIRQRGSRLGFMLLEGVGIERLAEACSQCVGCD